MSLFVCLRVGGYRFLRDRFFFLRLDGIARGEKPPKNKMTGEYGRAVVARLPRDCPRGSTKASL